MEDIDVHQYFLCPISLQIMKDPVTTITGITYDRESIEKWLKTAENASCPVTKQLLSRESDLTPNHMLRRLIQAWCTANAKYGIDRIPTPKSPLSKSYVYKLIRDLKIAQFYYNALTKLDELAGENIEWNRKCMVEAGVTKVMVLLIIRCFKESKTKGLEEALRILYHIWTPTAENKQLVAENNDLFESLTWVLRINIDNHAVVKTHAIKILKMITEVASSSLIGQLKLDFFMLITSILRGKLSQQAIKYALHVLIQSCPWGTNRMKIIEAGAIFDVIELELSNPDKKTTELIFCLLAQLCSCADGRAQLLKHQAGIAMIAKRILRVSAATDDRSMHIFSQVTRFSTTNKVLIEMLSVGAVSKLCMVLQADCEPRLKKIAREILRLHSNVWNNSPCIQIYLLTRDPR